MPEPEGARLERIARRLHPLDHPTRGEGSNAADLRRVLGIEAFRDAAVLVGLVPRESGVQVLLTLRTTDLRHHAGQVSFPGGRSESGDADALATALRETHEETGIEPVRVMPLGTLDPLATVSAFRVVPVVARIDPAYIARPDPREVADVFEVPFDWLMQPGNLTRIEVAMGDSVRHVPEFVRDDTITPHRIWGVTAMILDNLRTLLED